MSERSCAVSVFNALVCSSSLAARAVSLSRRSCRLRAVRSVPWRAAWTLEVHSSVDLHVVAYLQGCKGFLQQGALGTGLLGSFLGAQAGLRLLGEGFGQSVPVRLCGGV